MSRINKDLSALIALFDTRQDVLLDERCSSLQPNAPTDVFVRRFTRTLNNQRQLVLVSKKYAGNKLHAIQQRESELLWKLRTLSFTTPQGTSIKVSDRVNYLHAFTGDASLLVDSEQEQVEKIEMPWAGFDLQDWRRLFEPQNSSPFHDVKFVLALLRSALKALYPLHGSGWIHSDIKLDNWCLQWLGGSLSAAGAPLAGRLNPDHLRAIDMGLTLEEKALRTKEIVSGKAIATEMNPLRHLLLIKDAHTAANSGNFKPLQQLDWRCDLMALGEMFDRLHKWTYTENASPSEDHLRSALGKIIDDLRNQTLPQNPAPPMPHVTTIKEINDLLQDSGIDKEWPFYIEGARMPGPAAAQPLSTADEPPTVVTSYLNSKDGVLDKDTGSNNVRPLKQDPPLPKPDPVPDPVPPGFGARNAFVIFSVVMLVTISIAQIYFGGTYTATPATQPAAKAYASNADELMAKLYATARAAEKAEPNNPRIVQLQASHTHPYSMGERIRFKVTTPIAGFLTVLMLDQGDKWPKLKPYLTNQPVRAGQTSAVPDELFPMHAEAPAGTMRIMAVVTPAHFEWAASFNADKVEQADLQNIAASATVWIEIEP